MLQMMAVGAAALRAESRHGRQGKQGRSRGQEGNARQAGPGAPTGCNMEATALRVEAVLLRILARETY